MALQKTRFNRVHPSTFLLAFIASCVLSATAAVAQEQPKPQKCPYTAASKIAADVPRGTVTDHEWLESKVFPGTKRRYSVYVPAQYDAEEPAALMVFQDGHEYLRPVGAYRATVVMDNLIHSNEMPVTIGVFVDPGHKKEQLPDTRGWQPEAENRRFEYDSLSEDYVNFLLTEILPQVEKDYQITQDPSGRAICGASSGGICAFTAAWQRPDKFGKVVSHIGSFTNILHGDTYPGTIRKTDKKPIRVYLQDGSRDLDNEHGNWPLANQQMAAALEFKGYDFRFDYGEGAHDGNHGGAVLPDAFRWLWRDYRGVNFVRAATSLKQTDQWAKSWWMPRHEEKLATRKIMPKVDLLLVGDSITHGWENAGRSVWDEYYAHRNTYNIGFGGDRTEHVIWRLQNGEVDDIAPKLAMVMIGTNNVGQLEPAKNTAAGIQRVLEELRMRLPETKILLLGIFPREAEPTADKRVQNSQVNAIIKSYADDQHVWYLDIGEKFLDEQGVLHKSVMYDLLHFDASGYRIWAEAVEPMVKKLMGEG